MPDTEEVGEVWNPQRYRDTDHGLAPDEAFEPVEIEDTDRPGPDQPHVRTVLGRIAPEDVGVALMQEHLFRSRSDGGIEETLTGGDAALTDLETFFSMGGRTLVEATRKSDGRDSKGLLALARQAPMHLIASASVTMLDGEYDSASLNQDLVGGMEGTGVQPGIIDLWLEGRFERSTFERLLERISDADLAGHLPLRLHADATSMLRAVETWLVDDAYNGNLIITGVNGMSAGQVSDLLDTTTLFQVDGLAGVPDLDAPSVDLMADLLSSGADVDVLFAQGFTHRSQLHGYGGRPGLTYIFDHIAVMLLERGVSAKAVRAMLVDNAAGALTIRP